MCAVIGGPRRSQPSIVSFMFYLTPLHTDSSAFLLGAAFSLAITIASVKPATHHISAMLSFFATVCFLTFIR